MWQIETLTLKLKIVPTYLRTYLPIYLSLSLSLFIYPSILSILFLIKTPFGLSGVGGSVYVPRCRQGQTGALANILWLIIMSTINFHKDTRWLSANTNLLRGAPAQPSTSHCLSNHIPPCKGLPACYPIVPPTQTRALLGIQSFSSPRGALPDLYQITG